MTNTRITDPEILERRYPVILRQFSIRQNSGGHGKYKGGDGCIRELEFTRPLTVSILSERRAFQPYGMNGGCPGTRGLNLLKFSKDSRTISLGGKNSLNVNAGDTLTIMSPGGGGYGQANEQKGEETKHKKDITASHHELKSSGSLQQYVMNQESV